VREFTVPFITLFASDVRIESKAAFGLSASHFRTTPINGHRQTGLVGPVRAKLRSGEPFADSPLYPDERTSSDRADWSVSYQQATK
jgi:hypothetical protein